MKYSELHIDILNFYSNIKMVCIHCLPWCVHMLLWLDGNYYHDMKIFHHEKFFRVWYSYTQLTDHFIHSCISLRIRAMVATKNINIDYWHYSLNKMHRNGCTEMQWPQQWPNWKFLVIKMHSACQGIIRSCILASIIIVPTTMAPRCTMMVLAILNIQIKG